jgi:hypothetical protein
MGGLPIIGYSLKGLSNQEGSRMRGFLLLLCLAPHLAYGWGNLGHQTICNITLEELTPAARVEVDRLIALDPSVDNFAQSCTYADFPRRRPPGHFLNLPRSASAVVTDDCPMADDCLFRAFLDDLAILSNPNLPDADRLRSLKLLSHWVGDFHQPLHVSFKDDRGGNQVLEQGGPCDQNLHSVWDTCIIKEEIGPNAEDNAVRLEAQITNTDREAWQLDSPVEWANESFQITREPSVEYCVLKEGACWYSSDNIMLQDDEPRRKVTVEQTYRSAHVGTISMRLKQAAVRLAHVLNTALE